MKKSFFLLALIVLTLCFCASANGEVTYTWDPEGTLTVSGTGNIASLEFLYEKKLVNLIIGDEVTGIEKSAFLDCENLTSVTFGKGLKFIGISAFCNCTKLTDLKFPDNLESIEQYAFFGCEGLQSVTIPKGISMGKGVFKNCINIKKAVLPEGMTVIEPETFYGCQNLESITIPGSVTRIGDWAFCHCNNLPNLTIPDGVKSIGNSVFCNCNTFTEITIPDSVTTIDYNAFKGCINLESINLSKNLSYLSYAVFANCTKLTHVSIPNGADCIGEAAFGGCTSLEYVEIPISVTSIEKDAFSLCSGLKDVYYAGTVADKQKMKISSIGNSTIKNANWHYESTAPKPIPNEEKKTIKFFNTVLLDVPISFTLTNTANERYTYTSPNSKLVITGGKINASTYDELKSKLVSAYGDVSDLTLNGIRVFGVAEINSSYAMSGIALVADEQAYMITFLFTNNPEGVLSTEIMNTLSVEDKYTKIKSFVTRCYTVILGRGADEQGLGAWAKALANGEAQASQIIDGFVNSQEFLNKGLSKDQQVVVLYKAMLGREPDPAGLAAWTDVLNQGYPFGSVINGFCGSKEFINLCNEYGIQPGSVNVGPVTPAGENKIKAFVRRCYQIILGRDPDAAGLDAWADALATGKAKASEIIDGFVNSQEYLSKNLSHEASVKVLYNAMLGRDPDPAGLAAWVKVLDDGNPFAAVINGFCGSTEFINLCNEYGIQPGSVQVKAALVKRVSITPEGSDAEESATYVAYTSEYINEEKIRAFVKHCYETVLGREGDEEGIANYTALVMDGKKTPKRVAYEFVFSPEFQNQLPGNEDLIRILYRLYLNREPGAEELAGWIEMLDGGAGLDEVLKGFAESAEFRAIMREMKE